MAFTEITTQSWGSRLMKSIKSVLVGLVLFVVSFPLLFWNEGRAVKTAKMLAMGASAVVSVVSDKVDPSKEGKLVHTSGTATTDETLSDDEFKVSAKAIKLTRDVEMYQWKENKKEREEKQTGGSTKTITTYEYEKTWSSRALDSSDYRENGHDNPGMPFQGKSWVAKNVTLGAFKLTEAQVAKLDKTAGYDVDAKAVEGMDLKSVAKTGTLYLAPDRKPNPESPQIGDVKVSFTTVPPGPYSLVAQQAGDSFVPFVDKDIGEDYGVLLVQDGTVTAAAMFQKAEADNAMMTWVLRVVGFAFMFIGLLMVFKPISAFGDVIPMVGSMLGAGLGLFAFFISAALSLLTVGVAWLFYRPVLGVALLVLAIGAMVGLVMLAGKKKAAKAAAAPAP